VPGAASHARSEGSERESGRRGRDTCYGGGSERREVWLGFRVLADYIAPRHVLNYSIRDGRI
jgi:hypothetical protein